MLAVSSCTTGNQNFIQYQILFTHLLISIVGNLYRKTNKEQNIISEEDLKNNIILESRSSIDIFRNPHLVTDINKSD